MRLSKDDLISGSNLRLLARRQLGSTGLWVSALSVGSAPLGMAYGIEAPGEFGPPSRAEVLRLLGQAAEMGINLFDTAPGYGESETMLGEALGTRSDCYIATKVAVPRQADGGLLTGRLLQRTITDSLEGSLKRLRRETLDVVQIHNATAEVIAKGEILEILEKAQSQGKVAHLGASVYGEESALAAIQSGCLDVVQVAYNLLDQRMASKVFPTAIAAGVGILIRSVFLKGVLTPKGRWLPRDLKELGVAVNRVRSVFRIPWHALPATALRFCLAAPAASVLVGVRTSRELEQAVEATGQRPLSPDLLSRAASLARTEEHLLNPSYWSVA